MDSQETALDKVIVKIMWVVFLIPILLWMGYCVAFADQSSDDCFATDSVVDPRGEVQEYECYEESDFR